MTAHGEGIFLHSYVGKRAMRPTVTLNLRIRIDNNQGCFYLSRYEATYFVPDALNSSRYELFKLQNFASKPRCD